MPQLPTFGYFSQEDGYQWANFVDEHEDRRPNDIHVVPTDDMKPHYPTDCWCHPDKDYTFDPAKNVIYTTIVHNSFELRYANRKLI